MAKEDGPSSESLYIRPVTEEFKTFAQHKIEFLERFKKVDQLSVYLDALELGIRTIQEIQMEDREEQELAEVEFQGAPEYLAEAPALEEEEPDIETEELEAPEGEGRDPEEEWALADEGEVLVGEREEDRIASVGGDQEMPTEETGEAGEVAGSGEEEEKEVAESPEQEGAEGEEDGVLTRRWAALAEDLREDAREEGQEEVEGEVEGEEEGEEDRT
ncbi:MAG: hypothetical protein ACYTHM_08635 [Planctomycetota bacterium]|jgi:hypothetical protein